MSYWEDIRQQAKELDIIKFKSIKYRCEQNIITKLNAIPISTVTLKADYCVEILENIEKSVMNVKCNLDDLITSIYPVTYKQSLEMIADLEKLKHKAVIGVDMSNGKMGGIANYDELLAEWKNYKENFRNRYDFIRSIDSRKTISDFLESVEKVITNEDLLLAEFQGKMFFMLLFDGYLVGKQGYNDSYEITFPSQLFTGVTFPMTIHPHIIRESEEKVLLERKSSIGDDVKRLEAIEKIYDERFKPSIQYKFSEYNAEFYTKVLLNDKERTIENAQCYIIEEVTNNVSLTI